MPDRKLFYALDEKGEKHFIDHLKDRSGIFVCPHCKQAVLPRMGQEKVWHFAHVGELCAALKKIDADTEDASLLKFQTKESAPIEVGDAFTFLCPLCKGVGRKMNAIRLVSQQYICKACYSSTPAEILSRL